MDLSIVTTLYRSAGTLEEFHRRACEAAGTITDRFEVIYVNDGSPDDSLAVALRLHESDPRVRVVDLSRNFGHHHAIMAGLAHAAGERIFLIDVDLEEDPAWLGDFWKILEAEGQDVVFGVQAARVGHAFVKHSGTLFYRVFNALSPTRIPENPCTVRLMRREYVDALLTVRDRNLFLAGNFAWAGFRQRAVPVAKRIDPAGSTYSLIRRLNLLVTALTSFSAIPLRLIFLLGLIISLVAGLSGTTMIVLKLLHPARYLIGYPSLLVSIWFVGGLLVFFLGVIGIYLAAIFNEVKDRPMFIIKHYYSRDDHGLRRPG
ncbi:MAG: glycosyltransferase family 2 protein [Isosphaeraceae bacterium]|nr:glycosyltransferase family 2 protein [Isosphaeraceae bacterium]